MQIEMGALSQNLADQIEEAGCEYCGSVKLETIQRCADAISLLLVRGYLPPSQVNLARKRLIKDILVREKEAKDV